MAGSLVKDKYESYKTNANEALQFVLVRNEKDIEDCTSAFLPEFTHQIFGENEIIFGYQGLTITIYLTASRLQTCIDVEYKQKLVENGNNLKADDIYKLLKDAFPVGFITNKNEIPKQLENDNEFQPPGKLIHSYKSPKNENEYQVYQCDATTSGLKELHSRFEPFILFYIDAASFIDLDDSKWRIYYLFERYPVDSGTFKYATIGFTTVYDYYAYPMNVRPRISQMLILPPFQRCGHGCELLQAIYNDLIQRSDVLDITVEDPSENFMLLRDYLDAKNCMSLNAFSPENLRKGFSPVMVSEARAKFKLCKKQARRVYEILRLKTCGKWSGDEYRRWEFDMKQRLQAPLMSEKRLKKISKYLTSSELQVIVQSMEEKKKLIDDNFDQIINEYRITIERLGRK